MADVQNSTQGSAQDPAQTANTKSPLAGITRNKVIAVVAAVLVVVYGVSPVDLVNDLVPILGYIDDIAVAIAGIATIANLLSQRKQAKMVGRETIQG